MARFLPSRAALSKRVAAVAILLALFPLLGALGRLHWILDLFSHFRLQYAAGLALCAIALAALRRPRSAMLGGLGALVLAATFAAWFLPSPARQTPGAIKVIAFNVNTANDRHDAVADFLLAESADIVLLQEISQEWTRSLARLRGAYPHRIEIPRGDNFGIGVYSKLPLLEAERQAFSEFEVPWLSWTVERDGIRYRFAGVHTVPPISAKDSALRNAHLGAVRDWVLQQPDIPTVVLGDLNVTIFSPWLAGFLRDARLHDTAKGFGLRPTWMVAFPPAAIAIDQILATRHLAATARRIGPPLGSDHRALIVQLAPAPASSSAN